jgi:hypothetical protein
VPNRVVIAVMMDETLRRTYEKIAAERSARTREFVSLSAVCREALRAFVEGQRTTQ